MIKQLEFERDERHAASNLETKGIISVKNEMDLGIDFAAIVNCNYEITFRDGNLRGTKIYRVM